MWHAHHYSALNRFLFLFLHCDVEVSREHFVVFPLCFISSLNDSIHFTVFCSLSHAFFIIIIIIIVKVGFRSLSFALSRHLCIARTLRSNCSDLIIIVIMDKATVLIENDLMRFHCLFPLNVCICIRRYT